MARTRRVIGPGGSMINMTFPEKTESKSAVKPTVKEVEQISGQSTENGTEGMKEGKASASPEDIAAVEKKYLDLQKKKAELTIPMIKAMEPQELRVVAKELKVKLGNVKKKVKMQDKLIKELGLEEDVL